MIYSLPTWAGIVVLIIVLCLIFKEVLVRMTSGQRGRSVVFDSPFIDLDVTPVSEGDRVVYAYYLDGRYTAHVVNNLKRSIIDLEADSKEELEEKVASTFRTWSVAGQKHNI